MKRREPGYFLFSLASGCLWALIALTLGYRAFGPSIWGGILAAPLIGLLMGVSSAWFDTRWQGGRALFSLVSLYVAASLFGFAMTLYDLFVRGIGPAPSLENLLSGIAATLWGITFTGYFAILWPLAYLNHRLLWLRLE
jgi:hypothetical protein